MRRLFLKLFGISILGLLVAPYKLLYSQTKKIINQNLTNEQKNILFNEGTEMPFTSSLLHEKSCLLYTSPSPRDLSTSRMPSSA